MRIVKLLMAVLLIGGCNSSATAVSEKPVRNHPYLYFTSDEIAKLKERIDNDAATSQAWSQLLENANNAVESSGSGRRRGGGMENLCLAYRMTGEKKFAESIKQMLIDQIQNPRRDEMLARREPPWNSGLGTGRLCYSLAVGFDCVYDFLSAEERKTIAEGIVEVGIMPIMNDWVLGAERIHSLDTMGHNWWSCCVFNAGVASMAIMNEEPRARQWLERISDGSLEWLEYSGSILENKPASFDSEGGFYESVNYSNFGVSQYLLFRLAYSNTFGALPLSTPMVEKIGEYFLHVGYPNSDRLMSLNFGDGSITVDGSMPVTLMWALGYHKPAYLWYLNQTRGSRFREGINSMSAFALVYRPSEKELAEAPGTPDLPVSMMFEDMGWVIMRSSWEKDATMLGVKSGVTWNHAHADAGSFILFHHGRNLLIDSGNCSYSLPAYDDYYRQSVAHNVVLFNGKAENPEDTYFGSMTDGTVSNLLDAGDLKYVMADATGPTSQYFARNFRHFLWIGDLILIIDDLKSFEPGQFQWLLHFNGKGQRNGKDIEIVDGDASVIVRPLFPMPFPDAGLPTDYPENMRLAEKVGLKDHDADTKVTYFSIEPTELTRRTKFITAVMPLTEKGRDGLPQIERFRGIDVIGLRIRQNGTVTELYMNLKADGSIMHRNANLIHNGWETDSYLMAMTYPEGADTTDPDAVLRYFIADGSYLRRDGKIILDSLSKVFMVSEVTDTGVDVLLQGQPYVNAYLRVNKKPVKVTLNHSIISPEYNNENQTITLRLNN